MLDENIITLAHGDGEKITLDFINREILTRFGNPILNLLEDGSWIKSTNGDIVISTDSYIIDPLIFPGGDIGKLAVSGTINDLVASGAIPQYLTLSLIMSEGLPLSVLRQILDSARNIAHLAGVLIVAGDTKVIERQPKPTLYINTTGIGTPIKSNKNYRVSCAADKDKIIVTGYIGDHGLAVLSEREGLGFENRVVSDCYPLNELMLPLLAEFDGVHSLRDPTRGGLIGSLIDIAEASAMELIIDEEAIPVRKDVKAACAMLGIDPLFLANEGKMVIAVKHDQCGKILERLRNHPLGRDSMVIGDIKSQVHSDSGRLILRKKNTKRQVVRPNGSKLPRLC